MDNGAAAAAGMVPPGIGADGVSTSTEIIMVPDNMVGFIIGRRGEQITRLQAENNCKIQMSQDSSGMAERQCTLTGMAANILRAKASIERIISSDVANARPGGAGPGTCFEIMIPGNKVGLVIGKGGEMIKQMQEQTGAKIVIIQDSPEATIEKPLRITGASEAVEAAKLLVSNILEQNQDGMGRGRSLPMAGVPMRGGMIGRGGMAGRGGFGMAGMRGGMVGQFGDVNGGGQNTDCISVPTNKVGLVIGKNGETIKSINQTCGAHCEIDRTSPPDAREKTFIIKGTPDAIERVKAMISEKIGGFVPGGGMGGGASTAYPSTNEWGAPAAGGGGAANIYGGAQAGNAPGGASGGQHDYSQEWIEYYRQMGMSKEAEAIEMSRAANQAVGGVPPNQSTGGMVNASVPAPNGTPQQPGGGGGAGGGGAAGTTDYSAQWAEYYRSIGKFENAEMIDQQIKLKQQTGAPGGANGGGAAQPAYGQQYAGYYGA